MGNQEATGQRPPTGPARLGPSTAGPLTLRWTGANAVPPAAPKELKATGDDQCFRLAIKRPRSALSPPEVDASGTTQKVDEKW